MKEFIKEHFNDTKLSKENELSPDMTIKNTQSDSYANKIFNIGN